MPLTDKTCKNAKPAKKPYKKADFQGLYLEVMPNGSKYWRLKYRFLGKEKRLALGVYPEVSLLDARKKKDVARELLAESKDPGLVRKEQKETALQRAATTFELVAREWHDRNRSQWSGRHSAIIISRMENDVFPEIGKLPISDIRPLQVLHMAQKIKDRGAHETAKRALQYCGQVFRYAVITERALHDPTAPLKKALTPGKTTHFASIESEELPDFLQILERNDARLFTQTRHAIKLLMLTFVRTSELIEATWGEFSLEGKQWLIPAERMKMKRTHIVPLSDQACEILREQQKLTGKWEWVFPNQAHPQKCMSNMTILKALERMGYKGRMTGHGFRALAMSTIKEKLNYRHEVIDTQLAHAKSKANAPYDRAVFLNDRRQMMQQWADYLDRAATNDKSIKTNLVHAEEHRSSDAANTRI